MSEVFDAAGMRIYKRPWEGRVGVRMKDSPEQTGIPLEPYAALQDAKLSGFFVDAAEAKPIIEALASELLRWHRRPEAELLSWLENPTAEPARLTRRINVLQDEIRTARHHRYWVEDSARWVVRGAFSFLALFALSIPLSLLFEVFEEHATTGVHSFIFESLVVALCGIVVWFSLPRRLPRGASLAATGAALSSAAGAPVLLVFPLVVSAVWMFHSWILERRALFFPEGDKGRLPECPHIQWQEARMPCDLEECSWYIAGSYFTSIPALWRDLAGYWASEPRDAPPQPRVNIAGFRWPPSALIAGGGLLLGAPDSGKTRLMWALAKGVASHPGVYSMFYDPKRRAYARLHSLLPAHEIVTLFPLDARASSWDLASDVLSEADAEAVAIAVSQTVPGEDVKHHADFFERGGIEGTKAVLLGVMELSGGKFSLRDVICATEQQSFNKVLVATEFGRAFVDNWLTQNKNSRVDRWNDLRATVASNLDRLKSYAQAAEVHYQAGRRFSLRAWAGRETKQRAVVLGRSMDASKGSMDIAASLMLTFAKNARLSTTETTVDFPKSLFFVDELQMAPPGFFDSLHDLLTLGRELNTSVWSAAQDFPALAVAFGSRDKAEAFLGLHRWHLVTRLDCAHTAQEVSRLFGNQVYVREGLSWNEGGSSGGGYYVDQWNWSETWNHGGTTNRHSEPLVDPSLPLRIPVPSPTNGLVALVRRDELLFAPRIHANWVDEHDVPMPPDVPVEERLDMRLYPWRGWTDEDRRRLFGEGHSTQPDILDEILRRSS